MADEPTLMQVVRREVDYNRGGIISVADAGNVYLLAIRVDWTVSCGWFVRARRDISAALHQVAAGIYRRAMARPRWPCLAG